jgi:NAD(P) transhydrogenase subunit beta
MPLTFAVGGYIVFVAQNGAAPLLPLPELLYLFFGCALIFGILMTLPIGGADMPVVISVFNAFTGLAVGHEGFVLQNPALMIAGMVVGAAGMLLTILMAKAMNRSISNVLFTNFGEVAKHKHTDMKGSLKPIEAGDAGIFMRYASSVIIVPGYGLAAAQGQQKLYEFVKLLIAAGVKVRFAIHPVAGRMPGQMDVLLAEAGVPYDLIFQLDDINDDFATTDVVLVIGANDVVNPAARTDKSSPIFGMPILNADKAKKVYVVKRGQGKGYSGIENALFYDPNCYMVYGDAQAVMAQMIEAVRGLGASKAACRRAIFRCRSSMSWQIASPFVVRSWVRAAIWPKLLPSLPTAKSKPILSYNLCQPLTKSSNGLSMAMCLHVSYSIFRASKNCMHLWLL